MTATLLQADARDIPLADASIDAIVCDPPYELGFMGKGWDSAGVAFNPATWAEALRVAKPGAHLLAFGGTRTHHRLAVAIEDAGWEIRDCLMWLYGSGFPKSLDVGKAIDRAAGELPPEGSAFTVAGVYNETMQTTVPSRGYVPPPPATDAAREWDGWGTALKPAWEPVILARKPLTGTVAQNVQAHGTGALNIDGSRIGTEGGRTNHTQSDGAQRDRWDGNTTTGEITEHGGRWPANLLLDDAAAARLDAEAGAVSVNKAGVFATGQRRGMSEGLYEGGEEVGSVFGYGDTGGPSRFFYTAKASRTERGAGLERFAHKTRAEMTGRAPDAAGLVGSDGSGNSPRSGANYSTPRRNDHPTVKPLDLMRYLCALITPPGGTVLDPFMGSGSTGMAALDGGFDFVGIDQDPHYVELAQARIAHRHVLQPEERPPSSAVLQGALL